LVSQTNTTDPRYRNAAGNVRQGTAVEFLIQACGGTTNAGRSRRHAAWRGLPQRNPPFRRRLATISNKSVDLNAATYQDFRRLLSRVSQDLEKLEAYSGTDWGGDSIKATDMSSKGLRLIIPMGSVTPVQREAIKAATIIARSKNLRLIVTEF
jgi:hypothetical protein